MIEGTCQNCEYRFAREEAERVAAANKANQVRIWEALYSEGQGIAFKASWNRLCNTSRDTGHFLIVDDALIARAGIIAIREKKPKEEPGGEVIP